MPLNIEMLQRIKKLILEEPRRLEMDSWGYIVPKEQAVLDEKLPPCGTVGCIAGWANILDEIDRGIAPDHICINHQRHAARILGLDDSGDNVFCQDKWPEPFATKYALVRTKEGKAKVTAEYIDHLCET